MAGVLEKSNNAAGGTDGVAVTVANSGGASGDPWDRLIIPGDVGAGNVFEYEATTPTPPSAPAGTKWYHVDQGVGTPQLNCHWTFPTPKTQWALLFQLYIVKAPTSGNSVLFRGFSDAAYGSSALAIDVNLNSNRTMYLRNGKTGEAFSGTNTPIALALNTTYTCSLLADYTTLTATLNIYVAGSGTLFTTCTVAFTTSNVVQSMRWGAGVASADIEVYVTNIREGSGDFLTRPDLVAAAPVVTSTVAARRTYQTGTVITVPWSAHDTDGTISSLTIDWASIPAGAATPTITDASGGAITGIGTATATRTSQATLASVGTYVLRATATDSGGLTHVITRTFEVYPAANIDTILRQVTLGAFTVVGGPANTSAGAITALGDGSAATAVDSGVTPTSQTCSIQLGPLGPTGIVFRASANVVNGGTLTRVWRVYLEDHTTQIYTVTESGITGTTTDVLLTLNAAALSLVPLNAPEDVGRAALWVDFTDTVA